jgi:hypothetical protein
MPRLKKARKPRTPNLKPNICWYLDKSGLSYEDAAVITGMSRATFFSRMRNPENFTIKELSHMADYFKTSLQTLQFGEIGGHAQ